MNKLVSSLIASMVLSASAVHAGETENSVNRAPEVSAKDVLYGPVARTTYRWNTSSLKEESRDWSGVDSFSGEEVGSDSALASSEAVDKAATSARQSIYKWGIRSSADQSIYKWGIRSSADQSIYKWGIRSSADQSIYKWGIRSSADQSIYKWGIR